MKLLIALLASLSLFGCTQNSSTQSAPDLDNPEITSSTEIDISKFSSNVGDIDFGGVDQTVSMTPNASPSNPVIRTKVVLKNKLNVPLSFSLIGPSNDYFKIILSRCVSPLAANSQCEIVVQFSSRGLYDGTFDDTVVVNESGGSMDSVGVNFLAHVQGKPDPDQSGKPIIEMSMFEGFNDNILSQDVIVKNVGTGTAVGISSVMPAHYAKRFNRCPQNLKPGKSCRISVFNKNFRTASSVSETMTVQTSDQGADSQLTLGLNVNYKYPRNCLDAINRQLRNDKNDPITHRSGVYTIDKDGVLPGELPRHVYCDQTTAGGGWTAVANVWMIGAQNPDPDMADAGQYVTDQVTSTIEFNSVRMRCHRQGMGMLDEARSLPLGQTTTNLNVFGNNRASDTTVFYNGGGGGGNWSTQNNGNFYTEMHYYNGQYQRLFFRVNQIHCVISYESYGGNDFNPILGDYGEVFVR